MLHSNRFLISSLAISLLALASAPAWAKETVTRELSLTIPVSPGQTLKLENLAGEVTLQGSSGSSLQISARVVAGGADAAAATALADTVRLARQGDTVHTVYPVEDYDTYFYYVPDDDDWGFSRTSTEYQDENVMVTSNGNGVPLHVDFVIQVPADMKLAVENQVGRIVAREVQADLSLDTGSGEIKVGGGQGELSADTGSGDVVVGQHQGRVAADTGSGDVIIEDLQGDLAADTGSGDVLVRGAHSARLVADTGSGDVTLENVTGELVVDAGSGDVSATGLTAGSGVSVDTGSGNIRLAGDLAAVRQLSLSAGSGDIEIHTNGAPDARLRIATGSGDIAVDLPAMREVRAEEGSFAATLGAGAGHWELETGSGDVTVK